MKKLSIFFFLITLFCAGCKDESTSPEEKPEGCQQNIPWPSLADSPWPMYRADPQNTGRSKSSGVMTGIIEWTYLDSLLECNTGLAVTRDSLIIIPYHFSLKAFHFDGRLKWSIAMPSETVTAPVIGNDGTIYCSYLDIIAVNGNGNIKWKYSPGEAVWPLALNIGKDGSLYFMGSKNLYAVTSEGELKWKTAVSGFLVSFSPDGSTLYLTGADPGLTAVDAGSGIIKWSFGNMDSKLTAPLIDNEGNIYLTTKDVSFNSEPGMFCLFPDGKVKWYFRHSQHSTSSINHSSPTMDKSGNLYFAGDSLFSLDYHGQLRWKKALENSTVTPLINADGFIYVTLAETGSHHKILSYDTDGNLRLSLAVPGWSTISSPAIACGRLILPTQGKSLYSIR